MEKSKKQGSDRIMYYNKNISNLGRWLKSLGGFTSTVLGTAGRPWLGTLAGMAIPLGRAVQRYGLGIPLDWDITPFVSGAVKGVAIPWLSYLLGKWLSKKEDRDNNEGEEEKDTKRTKEGFNIDGFNTRFNNYDFNSNKAGLTADQLVEILAKNSLALFRLRPLLAGGGASALASTFLGTTGHPILGTLAGLGMPLTGLATLYSAPMSTRDKSLLLGGLTGAGLAAPWLSYYLGKFLKSREKEDRDGEIKKQGFDEIDLSDSLSNLGKALQALGPFASTVLGTTGRPWWGTLASMLSPLGLAAQIHGEGDSVRDNIAHLVASAVGATAFPWMAYHLGKWFPKKDEGDKEKDQHINKSGDWHGKGDLHAKYLHQGRLRALTLVQEDPESLREDKQKLTPELRQRIKSAWEGRDKAQIAAWRLFGCPDDVVEERIRYLLED